MSVVIDTGRVAAEILSSCVLFCLNFFFFWNNGPVNFYLRTQTWNIYYYVLLLRIDRLLILMDGNLAS